MPPLEGRKPRIFVADDDRAMLELILTRLDLAGYETAYGRHGREALAGITAFHPAVVILDVNMPQLDGFGVLEALHRLTPAFTAPVMLLTARHAPDDVQRALKLGAKDFLAKPFEGPQLLARVARLLRPKPHGLEGDGEPAEASDRAVLI
jgi:two-component system OmpR family response regulator